MEKEKHIEEEKEQKIERETDIEIEKEIEDKQNRERTREVRMKLFTHQQVLLLLLFYLQALALLSYCLYLHLIRTLSESHHQNSSF